MNTTDGTCNNQALELDSSERIDLALDDQNEGFSCKYYLSFLKINLIVYVHIVRFPRLQKVELVCLNDHMTIPLIKFIY